MYAIKMAQLGRPDRTVSTCITGSRSPLTFSLPPARILQAAITQAIIQQNVDAITAKNWTIDGKESVSLAEFGYDSVGIDEGWEGCGEGVNGTQHDAQGNPVINSKFPNLTALVEYGHGKGVSMGWGMPGWAGLLEKLPQGVAAWCVQAFDAVARLAPVLSDVIVVVGRPRRSETTSA